LAKTDEYIGLLILEFYKMWQDWKYGYASYLSLEKAAPENTKEAYIRDLNIFLRFLEENYTDIPPQNISSHHLEEFMAYIFDLGLCSRSQARILSGLKSFFKYLTIENAITENPTHLIEGPKLSRKIPDTLSFTDLNRQRWVPLVSCMSPNFACTSTSQIALRWGG